LGKYEPNILIAIIEAFLDIHRKNTGYYYISGIKYR